MGLDSGFVYTEACVGDSRGANMLQGVVSYWVVGESVLQAGGAHMLCGGAVEVPLAIRSRELVITDVGLGP